MEPIQQNGTSQNLQNIKTQQNYSESHSSNIPAKKIGKFKASIILAKGSFNILRKDKEMLWFPIISIIAQLVFVSLFVLTILLAATSGNLADIQKIDENSYNIPFYVEVVVILCFYIIAYFIINFFEAGVVTITKGRLENQDLGFQDGINTAKKNFGKIFIWSVISATIGLVIRIIFEKSEMLGKIIVSILGAAWSILTFFIIPVIVIENLSIKDSLKKSGQIIKSNWGETAISNIGIGAIMSLIWILGLIISVALSIFAINGSSLIALIVIITIFCLFTVTIGIISSTLSTILKVVLYEYTTKGVIPTEFNKESLDLTFKR